MGHNDQYLTFISSIGMIMNCLARLSGGLILEKIDFKIFYGFILLMSSTLAFSFLRVGESDAIFALYLALTYFV